MKRYKIAAGIAGISLAVSAFAFGEVSAHAGVTLPAPSAAWGCVDGSSRVLEHVYTIQANFEAYLNAHGGQCPPGGFVTAIGGDSSQASPSPSPSVSTSPPPTSGGTTTNDPAGDIPFAYSFQPGWSTWPNHSGADVLQGVNNQSGAFTSQSITAQNLSTWAVTANLAAGNKAVISYPATQNWLSQSNGGPFALAGMNSLTSKWNVTLPPNGDFEAAYDFWSQGEQSFAGGYNPVETMVWVANHGQTPAGTNKGNVTIGGVTYQEWVNPGGPVSLVMTTPTLAGTLDMLGIFKWEETNGFIASDTGLFGLSFGFELCSTNGAPETFNVNNLTMQRG